MRIHEPSQTPGRVAGLVGTVVVHAGAVLFLVAAVKPTRASPPSYAVELVAAPAPTTKRLAREALPTPPPEEKPAPTPPEAGAAAEGQASTGDAETTEASQDDPHARTQTAADGERAGAGSEDCGSGGAGSGRDPQHRN